MGLVLILAVFEGRTKLELKGNGSCYLNSLGTKFIMDTDSEFFTEWKTFKKNDNTINTGQYEFEIVA